MMQIQELEVKQLHTIAEWLHKMNEQDHHYVAWLASDPNEIFEQIWTLTQFHEALAYVAWEGEEVIGFLGILPFFEQKLCRLLGPFSTRNGDEVIERLWDKASLTMQLHFEVVKVACFEANKELLAFTKRHDFEKYNTEKTLALHSANYSPSQEKNTSIDEIQEYDYSNLSQLHPSAAYYTMNEMIELSQKERNKLWGYKEEGSLAGYLYFESVTPEEGEICFVNVDPSARSKGVGTSLLEHALQYAFYVFNLKVVTISVRVNNERAEHLYRQLGFEEIHTVHAFQKELNTKPGLFH
ncbi:N-acetyltransferase [Halobacillus sp. Marseille-Q1614]|uniref:GNAT family N-acetyltransferase n=1 Tax=Halobacillus sp. Marseille-Q1614 TaxID=2709134 RepID=UPI0020C5554A|nr:GNAT family N-acetyltransferase [Halobacillus sp. Marseille-Q1614]